MWTDNNIPNIIVAVAVLFFVFVLPRLVAGRNKRKRPDRPGEAPQAQPTAQRVDRPREKSRTIFGIPYEWEDSPASGEGPRPNAGDRGAKKRRRSGPAPEQEGGPRAEVSVISTARTAVPPNKPPVFSDDPVINGIVWAEILTRRGTGRRGMR